MANIDKETVAWHEQSLAIRSKNAKLITDVSFTTIPKPYILELTSYMDIPALSSLLSPQEQQLMSNGNIKVVECYLFNHRYADGSFFKMQLKFNPDNFEYGNINLGCQFIAPWQEVIDSGSVKDGAYVKIYGYREGGKVVFVFKRSDYDNNPEVIRIPI